MEVLEVLFLPSAAYTYSLPALATTAAAYRRYGYLPGRLAQCSHVQCSRWRSWQDAG